VPTVLFAVKVGDVATPLASVVPIAEVAPAKFPPAPGPGAENVTTTPDTGVPLDVTVAERVEAKSWSTTVVCVNGLFAWTVVTAAGVTVAGVELQPVKNARARTIAARTAQLGLPIMVPLPFLRLMRALLRTSMKFINYALL